MMALLARKLWRLPIWAWLVLIAIILGGTYAFVSAQPAQASWRYGACKVFLEQYVRFPGTVKIKEGWETSGSAGMSFTDRNPFGSEQVRTFECYYSTDAKGGSSLSKITLDRRTLPDAIASRFNAMLPTLAVQELNNDLPKPLPRNLKDMQDN